MASKGFNIANFKTNPPQYSDQADEQQAYDNWLKQVRVSAPLSLNYRH
jgi:hypothetical protein